MPGIKLDGQSGTFDPFWYDLGSFMSKTHVFDREL